MNIKFVLIDILIASIVTIISFYLHNHYAIQCGIILFIKPIVHLACIRYINTEFIMNLDIFNNIKTRME